MISGPAPLTVDFTDTSNPSSTSTLWDFGDGGTSIEANPQHTFAAMGLYTVTLTASNGISESTYTDQVLVIPDDQSSYWPLDEETGTRHEEIAGLNLTENNGVLNAPGMFGRAALFDSASSEYLSRAASGTELYPQGSFTMSFWIYPTSVVTTFPTPEPKSIVSKTSTSATDRPYRLSWFPGYNIATAVIVGTNGSSTSASTGAVLLPNQWNHVAFGYSTSDKKTRIWGNGGAATVASTAATANPPTTGACDFLIGASGESGAPTRFYKGRIQEARYFSSLLTDAEVAVLATEIPDAEQTTTTRAAQVMLRLSNDGGKTWIAMPWRSVGKQGEWLKRVRWNRLGAARWRVYEVSVTDPVAWRVVGAYLPGQGNGNG